MKKYKKGCQNRTFRSGDICNKCIIIEYKDIEKVNGPTKINTVGYVKKFRANGPREDGWTDRKWAIVNRRKNITLPTFHFEKRQYINSLCPSSHRSMSTLQRDSIHWLNDFFNNWSRQQSGWRTKSCKYSSTCVSSSPARAPHCPACCSSRVSPTCQCHLPSQMVSELLTCFN